MKTHVGHLLWLFSRNKSIKKKKKKPRDTGRACKGLNNDNNCIYNYSSAAKNVACLSGTPCWRKNVVYTNFSLHNMHTRAQRLLHIHKRTLLNTPEHPAPTKCKEFCVLKTHTKDVSNLGRLKMTALLQHELWRLNTHKPVQNKPQAPGTHRGNSNVLLGTSEVRF